MRNQALQLEANPAVEDDTRWELVERIVTSASFVRSPRLCSLLMHLCELALQGRSHEINEQSVGEALFERAPNYDPSIDGIVRSHASRLRQRLEQYFSEEGVNETIRVSIPKGGYTPLFEVHSPPVPEQASAVSSHSLTATDLASATRDHPASDKYRPLFLGTVTVVAVACIFIVYLLVRIHSAHPVALDTMRHPLWSTVFEPDHSTLIVASDTGLTSLQTLTGANISLAEYLSGDYRTHTAPPAGTTLEVVQTVHLHRRSRYRHQALSSSRRSSQSHTAALRA
jgi:hypothetical protein